MSANIPLVAIPLGLLKDTQYLKKKNNIIEHLNTILGNVGKKILEDNPLVIKTRLSFHITELVCNIVENVCPRNNNGKYDKKQLVLDVLNDVYDLTDEVLLAL